MPSLSVSTRSGTRSGTIPSFRRCSASLACPLKERLAGRMADGSSSSAQASSDPPQECQTGQRATQEGVCVRFRNTTDRTVEFYVVGWIAGVAHFELIFPCWQVPVDGTRGSRVQEVPGNRIKGQIQAGRSARAVLPNIAGARRAGQ